MPTYLVIKIEDPSDEMRMTLDDVISDFSNAGCCDDWEYVIPPAGFNDPEVVKRHTAERLSGLCPVCGS